MSLVPGALNFRDTGGLPAGTSRTRENVLFRSGHLAGLADDGRRAITDLGIRRIVDLRADEEVAYEPSHVAGLDIETVRIPLFLGSAASFFVDDLSLAEMYRGLVDDSADRLVEAARAVLSAQPVLVHCSVGKDRTGVTVGLLLAAAGVDEEAIVDDYARTEAMLPPERNARVLAYLRGIHPHARHLDDLATRSPASVMRDLLNDVRERYGSAAGYLRTHGLEAVEIDRWEEILIAH